MADHTERNKAFLANIHARGPFEGHGLVCKPVAVPAWSGPDNEFTTSTRPVDEWVPMVVENHRRQVELLEAVGHDDVPTADISTGTQLFAAAFGCRVHRYEDTNPCALPLVRSAAEADALAEPDIWKAPSLYRVFELADAVRRELGPDVPLGPPDKQTGFDTACLIWQKTGIYSAMLLEGEKAGVKRLTEKCTRLLIGFIRELRKEFPTMTMAGCPGVWCPPEMPPGFSNDECGAFGTELFAEFCLPELIELSEAFGGLAMHCCADAEHQFPLFGRIPNFYAFNRVAAKRGYLPVLEHFSGPDAPLHILAWITDETIEQLLKAAPEGTRFVFVQTGATTETAARWLDRMHELCPRSQAAV